MAKQTDGYYGVRKVIYVQVKQPAHKGEPQKHFSVYGVSLAKVIEAVDKGLAEAFGKTVAGRPGARRAIADPPEIRRNRKKKKKRSRRKGAK